MAATAKTHDIARETLRRLATSREAPTPENYQRLYWEIAGLEASIPPLPTEWVTAFRDLLRLLDLPHRECTTSDKAAAMAEALSAGTAQEQLDNLRSLVKAWSKLSALSAAPRSAAPVANELREMLAQTLEAGIAAQMEAVPDLAANVRKLAACIREGLAPADIASQLRRLWLDIELRSGDRRAMHDGLLRLLRLIVENVGELIDEDRWLKGQLKTISDLIAGRLTEDKIAAAERKLRDAVIKQGVLKRSLGDAQTTFKQMISTFVTRLGDLSTSTGAYHDRIGALRERIRQADDVGQIANVVDEVMEATRAIQASALQSRDELAAARRQVEAAERKIRELENEIEHVSEKVREDELTGVLNRRGVDEAFARELAIYRRQGRPLSVAMLDIDNFKALNDTHGHQAGDRALVNLARVIRETVRPNDVVGRYGGEEFLVLLPETGVEEAAAVVERLQHALTKHFFLFEKKKLLITFSAGVAECRTGETEAEVVARADKALYQAKRDGKNRVVSA